MLMIAVLAMSRLYVVFGIHNTNLSKTHTHTQTQVLSHVNFGEKSLISKEMKSWQGPSILIYNDSMFTESDFRNIARIGQGSKMASLEKTGRFGLGFCSSYHWTDVVSFVSGCSFCVFDPHLKYVVLSRSLGNMRLLLIVTLGRTLENYSNSNSENAHSNITNTGTYPIRKNPVFV
jgi:sacsin